MERNPSFFLPPVPQHSSNPGCFGISPLSPGPGVGGLSRDPRAPRRAQHPSREASSAGHAHARTHARPLGRPPRPPEAPSVPPLTAAKTARPSRRRCLSLGTPSPAPRPRTNSRPHPRRWRPSRGFRPEFPTRSHLHQPGGFPASSTADTLAATAGRRHQPSGPPRPRPIPGASAPLGQGDPRPGLGPAGGGEVGVSSRPGRGSGQLPRLGGQSPARRKAGLAPLRPLPQTPQT